MWYKLKPQQIKFTAHLSTYIRVNQKTSYLKSVKNEIITHSCNPIYGETLLPSFDFSDSRLSMKPMGRLEDRPHPRMGTDVVTIGVPESYVNICRLPKYDKIKKVNPYLPSVSGRTVLSTTQHQETNI